MTLFASLLVFTLLGIQEQAPAGQKAPVARQARPVAEVPAAEVPEAEAPVVKDLAEEETRFRKRQARLERIKQIAAKDGDQATARRADEWMAKNREAYGRRLERVREKYGEQRFERASQKVDRDLREKGKGGAQAGPLVAVCHKGKTLYVAAAAVEAHLRHGDARGVCIDDPRLPGKGGKNKEKKDKGKSASGEKSISGEDSISGESSVSDGKSVSGESKEKGAKSKSKDKEKSKEKSKDKGQPAGQPEPEVQTRKAKPVGKKESPAVGSTKKQKPLKGQKPQAAELR